MLSTALYRPGLPDLLLVEQHYSCAANPSLSKISREMGQVFET